MENNHAGAGPSKEALLEIIRTQTEIAKAGLDLGSVMALVAERTQQLTKAVGAVVELAEGDEMVYRAACGIAQKQLGLRIGRQGSLSGLCVQERKILVCDDSETDARVDREACRKVGLRSMIVVPLNHLDSTVGVIKAVSPEVNAFSAGDIEVLGLLSELVAAAMFHAAQAETSELYHRATHDALTGLANRALYYDRLRQTLAQARRYDEQVAVLNIDMDGLKPINDKLGHRAGDAAIREVAARIANNCRQSDTVARLGGDEFGLILPRIESASTVEQYCGRLVDRIGADPLRFDEHELPLGASIGFAMFPGDADDIEDLVHKADQAMYEMKRIRKSARA